MARSAILKIIDLSLSLNKKSYSIDLILSYYIDTALSVSI